jgi:hypothetical protein
MKKNPMKKIEQVTPSQVLTLTIGLCELAGKYPGMFAPAIGLNLEKNYETAFELLTDCAARLTAEVKSETKNEN